RTDRHRGRGLGRRGRCHRRAHVGLSPGRHAGHVPPLLAHLCRRESDLKIFFSPRRLAVGIEGRAIARNIFLDGNTFRDSPSVSREAFVADYNLGLALIGGPFVFRMSYTERTREFETQQGNDKFASLTLSFLR